MFIVSAACLCSRCLRSPRLSFLQTLLSLLLSVLSLSSSHWCVGQQKVPKPAVLCGAPAPGTPVNRRLRRILLLGDRRRPLQSSPPSTPGLWTTCVENIFTDARGEGSGGIRGHLRPLLLHFMFVRICLSVHTMIY